MQDRAKGILFFLTVLIYYLFFQILVKSASLWLQIVLKGIWIILLWTFIFWLTKKIGFFKKFDFKDFSYGKSIVRYLGFPLFIISSMMATYSLFSSPENQKLFLFWYWIIFGIVSIFLFYLIGWILSKFENSSWFKNRAQWFQTGFIFGFLLSLIAFFLGIIAISFGPFISPQSFSKPFITNLTEFIFPLIFVFILFFIIGAGISFWGKLFNRISNF